MSHNADKRAEYYRALLHTKAGAYLELLLFPQYTPHQVRGHRTGYSHSEYPRTYQKRHKYTVVGVSFSLQR